MLGYHPARRWWMRWIVVILGMLLISGCGELAYSLRSECKKAVQAFKHANNSDNPRSGYADESDASKAHHERTVTDTLNGWIGNRPTP
jgi:hypothetical protein